MGRQTSTARDRILGTACELFYAHGIRGVGVDRVIAESGVAKATLYSHFPAKADLVLAYLRAADGYWQGQLHAAAEAAGPDPRDQLVGLFAAVDVTGVAGGFRGCPFLNTAAESAPGSEIHQATVAHKRAVRAWIRGLAGDAGARDPDALARALTLLLDGAMSAAAMDAGPDVPAAVAATARTIVDAAVGDGAPARRPRRSRR